MSESPRHWSKELNRYHWFVLIVCTLGWLFDCGDQQLFNLARKPAMAELLDVAPNDPIVGEWGGYATSLMLIGWATGGILFGIMGDRIGRAKTMVWTILAYSVFTGLGGLSQTVWQFMFFRFMTGLGVGGQFAVGVSLVAEVMPDRARTPALGMLQAFSALGNVTAALAAIGLGHLEHIGAIEHSAWRWMFGIGILPAFLAVLVITRLKEPEKWQKSVGQDKGHQKKAGSVRELFGVPRWRKNVILGMLLAMSGVIGLWGIGFFSIDLNRSAFRRTGEQNSRDKGDAAKDQALLLHLLSEPKLLVEVQDKIAPQDLLSPTAEHDDARRLFEAAVVLTKDGKPVSVEAVLAFLDEPGESRPAQSGEDRQRREAYLGVAAPAPVDVDAELDRVLTRKSDINAMVSWWGGITSMLFNIGAFLGIYSFSRVTQKIGRRPTFAMFFFAAFVTTAIAFMYMKTAGQVFVMVPLMGFFQLSVFGGYAIYFPELFPTHLRSTGVSFCYNIARFASAMGPWALGFLTGVIYKNYEEPMRYAGVTMCSIFLIGILIAYLAPETKDQPLPE